MAAIVHQDCLCMLVTGEHCIDKHYKAYYRMEVSVKTTNHPWRTESLEMTREFSFLPWQMYVSEKTVQSEDWLSEMPKHIYTHACTLAPIHTQFTNEWKP